MPALSPVSSLPSDSTSQIVHETLMDVFSGEKPKTTKDAMELYKIVTKLLIPWIVSELPERERTAVQMALYAEEEIMGCFSSCCLPRRR